MRHSIKLLAVISLAASTYAAQTADEKPLFHYQEVMIPMRDGVHLQTAILTPLDQKAPLPILLTRTPYGVPAKAPTAIAPRLKELMADGYILVYQNLRGRFKSEGVFKLSSQVNLADPKDVNETTDAYDAIDWLVKNVPENNGRVGIYGVSYDGLTAALTLLHPHPALKAVSEQASPVDQWMNDDMHRYGALPLELCLRILGDGAGRQEREHALQFRHLRHLRVVSEARPALQRQFQVSARLAALLERHRGASRLRRLLEARGVGQSTAHQPGAESERGGILGSGRPVGALEDFP